MDFYYLFYGPAYKTQLRLTDLAPTGFFVFYTPLLTKTFKKISHHG